jgi:muramoyltetrapeptide carboxypeptidase
MKIAPPLQKGDKVAILTPASHVDSEKWEQAIANVKSFDLVPYFSSLSNKKFGYLAGTDAERAEDFNLALKNPDVKAVWIVRGGYGTSRMVDLIDFELLRNRPIRIMGYSDNTFLLHAIYKNTGLICYHGAMAAGVLDSFTRKQVEQFFLLPELPNIILDYKEWNDLAVLNNQHVKGILVGGNLSIVNSLIGTAFDIDWTDKIVFLEDVAEKPYRIDRMLNQLKQCGKLNQARAFILGNFNQCNANDWNLNPENSLELNDIFLHYFAKLDVPVILGFPVGHISTQFVLPFGAFVLLNTNKKFISLNAQSYL